MDQGPLGVVPAALIRSPPSSLEEGIHSPMDAVFSNALSILAMIGCLLLIGWLAGSGDERRQHARPEDEPIEGRAHARSEPFEER